MANYLLLNLCKLYSVLSIEKIYKINGISRLTCCLKTVINNGEMVCQTKGCITALSKKSDFAALSHDKLTDYTRGVVCQLFILNILNMLRRSDFTAVFEKQHRDIWRYEELLSIKKNIQSCL